MALISEAQHILHPATAKAFAKYAQVYGESAIPVMENCGFDIVGVWKWSTGVTGRDLLITRFDSSAHQEECGQRIQKEIASGAFNSLGDIDVQIEEHLKPGVSLPYASAQTLLELQNNKPAQPRQYIITRMFTGLRNSRPALDALAKRAEAYQSETRKLALAYMMTSGDRGTVTEIWALEHGEMGNFAFNSNPETLAIDEELGGLLRTESIDLINPLPYSKLQ